MKLRKGLKIINEITGNGPLITSKDYIKYRIKLHLNKGDEVKWQTPTTYKISASITCDHDGQIISQDINDVPSPINYVDIINCSGIVSRGQMINGIFYGILGMQNGGYRKLKISPHLAYGPEGYPPKIPPNAVIIAEIWIDEIQKNKN